MSILVITVSFAISVTIFPVIRRLSLKLGRISFPREDRWHKSAIPTLGGAGILIAFAFTLLICILFFSTVDPRQWTFLIGSAFLFLVGIIDEFRPLTPKSKMMTQVVAATVVISLGYTSTFFSPRIENPVIAQVFNILLTYIWLIGITNAFNLLDNMDGLAGGLSLITAGILGYFFWKGGNSSLYFVSLALVGSLFGFLIFNYPPAKIFMGDSGSLFLGFTLAALAVAQQQQASNVLAVIGVPTLIFMLPILDTSLVTITRLMRGQSPVVGGQDHTSHRLVAFGLSERQVLFVLFSVAIFSAFLAALLESINYWLSLALVPILILSLVLVAAYLGRLKVVTPTVQSRQGEVIARWMTDLTIRRRFFEFILDFFLIGIAYYLAFLLAFDLQINSGELSLFLRTLPLAYVSAFIILIVFGVYQTVWRYIGFEDFLRNLQAAVGSVVFLIALLFSLNSLGFSSWVGDLPDIILLYYGFFLFLALTFSRSSFRMLDTLFQQHVRPDEQKVLIIGTGDDAELALRWIMMSPNLKYRPIGFIDEDASIVGRRIHGIRILGTPESLSQILLSHRISGVILTEAAKHSAVEGEITQICENCGCWVRRLTLEFQLVNN